MLDQSLLHLLRRPTPSRLGALTATECCEWNSWSSAPSPPVSLQRFHLTRVPGVLSPTLPARVTRERFRERRGDGSGRFGGALSFDGVNDLVTVLDANDLDLTTGMTLEAWVRPTAINGFETVVLKEAGSDLAYSLYGDNQSGRPSTSIRQGSTYYAANGTSQLPLNVWTHLAATYDGANLRLYVNGTQAGTLARTGAVNTSSGALRMGGNSIWNEWFAGRIDEVRVYDRALSGTEIQADMNAPIGSPPVDTTPPMIALTSPAAGASVFGTVTLSATASDNVGVAGVQFLLDGAALGADDTTAPYQFSWDTTAVAAGPHTLAARARDTSGNLADSNAVYCSRGQQQRPGTRRSVVFLDELAYRGRQHGPLEHGQDPDVGRRAVVHRWRFGQALGSRDRRFYAVPLPDPGNVKDLFCAGQTVLADGRVLVVGGHECNVPNYTGLAIANIFDPVTEQWTALPDMEYRRYYPTATTLPDGRALVTTGSDVTVNSYISTPEIYDPQTNTFTELTGANPTIANYAFMFVLPDGNVLAAGSDEAAMPTWVLDVDSQTWTQVDGQILEGGSAVMYLPGKIMKAGSSYRTPDSIELPGDVCENLHEVAARVGAQDS